jgi:flagellar basal body-associated protein FliL
MADKEQAAETQAEPKKKNPLVLFGVVGVLMLLEALGVYVLITMTSPKATEAQVDLVEGEDDDSRLSELLLVEDRFINISTGRVWQWQATIYLKVMNKNLERVQAEMEKRRAEINEGIAEIIAGAQDRHLREPGRETVKRQLTAYVNEVFGVDGEGVNRVNSVVISRWLPSPMDF